MKQQHGKERQLLLGFVIGFAAALLLGAGMLAVWNGNANAETVDTPRSERYDFYGVNSGLGDDYLLENNLTDEAGLETLNDVRLTDAALKEEDRSCVCTPDGIPVVLQNELEAYYFTVTYPLPEGEITLVFCDSAENQAVGILPNE